MMVSRQRNAGRRLGGRVDAQSLGLAQRSKDRGCGRADEGVNHGSAHLCIAVPWRKLNIGEGLWSGLFASHPPMAARIAALKAMAFQGDV